MNIKWKIIIVSIIIFNLTSCVYLQPKNPFLDNLSCQLPCWENIVPGVTNERDLLEKILVIENFKSGSFYSRDVEWVSMNKMFRFVIEHENKDLILVIYTSNNIVEIIYISGEIGESIGRLNSKIGFPEYIMGNSFPTITTLFLPSKGIVYSYDAKKQKGELKTNISSEILVTTLALFTPKNYEFFLYEAGAFNTAGLTDDVINDLLFPWNGFGSIEELYVP